MVSLGTVLVFEPDPKARQRIRAALPEAKLVFGSDSETVLDAAEQDPSALLVDVDRPDVSGYDAVLKLQVQRDLPVILLTGAAEAPSIPGGVRRWERVVRLQDVDTLRASLARALDEHSLLASVRQTLGELFAARSTPPSSELTETEEAVLKSVAFPVHAPVEPAPIVGRAAHFADLLKHSLTTQGAAKKLNVNSSRIRQRLTSSPPQLYGFRSRNEWRLPAFQFVKRGLVPNIEAVITRLPSDMDPVAVDRWFRAPNVDLVHEGKKLSPIAWLSQGLPAAAAAELAEDL